MFKRIVLAAALMVAPLVLSPVSVDAQESGMETAAASAGSGLTTSAANGRPTTMPAGMGNRPGEELPPGLMLTRGAPAAAEEEPPEDESGGDGTMLCPVLDPMTGSYTLEPCS